ncbi:MAG: cytochrome b N-terminal domain-containing protein [Planctomycetaceae bacterium]|nr:cytochrome b N-terminal domain-containing protein [Planctomycetaceae bacterium]
MSNMLTRLNDWLDHRTGHRELLHEALYERIPGGARWRYVWGSTLVFTFFVQLITGLFLWSAYSPSAQTAWESVYYIQEVMFLGKVVRGVHHFAAQAMVVLMALHLMQVIIDGAYKAPREINFWLGMVLMQIVLGLSLTGYLLPWDQKGYYATQVSTKIMGAAPVVGPSLQYLAQGGAEYGHHTLTRFFAMHAGILPAALVAFLALHIYVFRRHGITTPDPHRAPEASFWPDQVLRDAVACLGVLAVVLFFAITKGAELNAPANPSVAFEAARPEWYFLFLFRFLKFETIEHFGLAFGAIYLPGLVMTVIILMPIIAWWKGGHRFNVVFMWLLAIGTAFLTVLAIYEDNANPDHQAALHAAEREAHRVLELANGPAKIPVEGAVTLLRNDPFTQGPRIFARHCAACHRYDGHDGTGRLVLESGGGKAVAAAPTAADLGDFGSREWFHRLLTGYGELFRPLKNVEDWDYDGSEMKDWVDTHKEVLLKEENSNDLKAVIEALVAGTGQQNAEINEELAKRGQEILTEGTLTVGEMSVCSDCHPMAADDDASDGYPHLYRYGSAEWLHAFISDPGDERYYGEKNKMPAFGEQLSAHEMDLLVRWMTGDYSETNLEKPLSRRKEAEAALGAPEPAAEESEESAEE